MRRANAAAAVVGSLAPTWWLGARELRRTFFEHRLYCFGVVSRSMREALHGGGQLQYRLEPVLPGMEHEAFGQSYDMRRIRRDSAR